MPPVVSARVAVGARLLAVTLRADVKNPFGVVMVCQVSRRIRTSWAELDSHVLPPMAKQQSSSSTRRPFAGGADTRSRPVVLLRLRSISLTEIVVMLSPAIGSSDNSEAKGIETVGSIVRR